MANSKIMVVDDDANICELLRLYLEKEGFDPVIAPNGVKALELFDSEKPDLMLLDVMMPQLDGWQVCREIRKKSAVPIIMLTAKGGSVRQGARPRAGGRRLCGQALRGQGGSGAGQGRAAPQRGPESKRPRRSATTASISIWRITSFVFGASRWIRRPRRWS